MEKKGDVLNQLALISDLLERANLQSKGIKVSFDIDPAEFERMFTLITEKNKSRKETVDATFAIKIGDVDIIFNKSNV